MPKAFLILPLLLSAGTAGAGDEFNAKEFVETKCVGCHDSGVYTRSNRRVDSLAQLEAQVRRCDANLGITLFDEEIAAIVTHLNDSYYKFDQ